MGLIGKFSFNYYFKKMKGEPNKGGKVFFSFKEGGAFPKGDWGGRGPPRKRGPKYKDPPKNTPTGEPQNIKNIGPSGLGSPCHKSVVGSGVPKDSAGFLPSFSLLLIFVMKPV